MPNKVTPITPATKPMDLAQIQVLNAVINRALLASKLGQQYGGDRNIYQALGYPLTLKYDDFAAFYERLDIAAAVINRPVEATWRGGFDILEADKRADTPLEAAFQDLYEKFSIHSKLARLDRLAGIGQYGVLLLGLDDVPDMVGFQAPVKAGKRKLMYLRPFGEGNAEIAEYERNPNDERYGMPVEYFIKISDPQTSTISSSITQQIRVHWSRVVHICDGLMESDIAGTPRLQAVYNRLMDLEKLVGAGAEMFWRGARPGYGLKFDKDFQVTPAIEQGLKDQFNEFEHNLRRILALQGLEGIENLAQQLGDPGPVAEIIIQMISAETGIPKRILTGSERGELASTQDADEWNQTILARRGEYAEPIIIRPFVDTCIRYGILPPAGKDGYSIDWTDLWSMSEDQKVTLGNKRSTSIKDYASTPGAQSVIAPRTFMRECLAFSDEQIELAEQELDEGISKEEQVIAQPQEVVSPGQEPGSTALGQTLQGQGQ